MNKNDILHCVYPAFSHVKGSTESSRDLSHMNLDNHSHHLVALLVVGAPRLCNGQKNPPPVFSLHTRFGWTSFLGQPKTQAYPCKREQPQDTHFRTHLTPNVSWLGVVQDP